MRIFRIAVLGSLLLFVAPRPQAQTDPIEISSTQLSFIPAALGGIHSSGKEIYFAASGFRLMVLNSNFQAARFIRLEPGIGAFDFGDIDGDEGANSRL